MLRAEAGEAFGPYTLIRALSVQGLRQRWIVHRTSDGNKKPYLLEVLPGPMAEHKGLPRSIREELAYLRTFRHAHFASPAGMALVKSHIGFVFSVAGTGTLEELLDYLRQKKIRMPAGAALELFNALAMGLTAFHSRQVGPGQAPPHLAIRPAHIFIGPKGQVSLSAAWVSPLEHLWPWGPPRSSMPYMSPEQVRGEGVGVVADIYALGAVLLECLTLRSYRKITNRLILSHIYKESITPNLDALPKVAELKHLVRRMANPDATLRPQNAHELVSMLSTVRKRLGRSPGLAAFLAEIGWATIIGVSETPAAPVKEDDTLRAPSFPTISPPTGEGEIPTEESLRPELTSRGPRLRPPTPSPEPVMDIHDEIEQLVSELEPEAFPEVDDNPSHGGMGDDIFGEIEVVEEVDDDGADDGGQRTIQEDPFAGLEAALSDLEVSFPDLEKPAEAPTRGPLRFPGGRDQREPRKAILRPNLNKRQDKDLSWSSVVVDISELLPEESVKPLENTKQSETLAYLTHVQKDGTKGRYPLDGTIVTIGRSPSNTVHVTGDGRVSRLHCRIILEDSNFVVEDAGSNNGTLVDGVFIKRQTLHGGEEIIIGGTVLQFSLADEFKSITPPF